MRTKVAQFNYFCLNRVAAMIQTKINFKNNVLIEEQYLKLMTKFLVFKCIKIN